MQSNCRQLRLTNPMDLMTPNQDRRRKIACLVALSLLFFSPNEVRWLGRETVPFWDVVASRVEERSARNVCVLQSGQSKPAENAISVAIIALVASTPLPEVQRPVLKPLQESRTCYFATIFTRLLNS
jgi:hypothetical protein